MTGNRTDILFISPNPKEAEIFKEVSKEYEYSIFVATSLEALIDVEIDPDLVLMSCSSKGISEPPGEVAQMCRQQYPEATLILVIPKPLSKADSDYIRKLGVHYLLQEHEISTSKPFFAINQILQSNYIPVKTTDLIPDHPFPFDLYHLMPQRKKFLTLLRSGDRLAPDRLERMKNHPEYYIHRAQADAFKKFVDATTDRSAKGLAKRCRANFVALKTEFTKLVLEISNESEKSSIVEGQELLAKCKSLCEDLLMNLVEFPKAWEIINNSSVGEFGSIERAPAVAAYCGLFGLQADQKKISEMMLIALITDIGLLTCSSSLAVAIKKDQELTPAQSQELKKVPARSLEMVLNRKLAFDEKSRSILMGVYEKADGTGYPAGVNDAKLVLESEVIRLAKDFDKGTLLKMGRAAADHFTILKSIANDPLTAPTYTKSCRDIVNEKILASGLFEERKA